MALHRGKWQSATLDTSAEISKGFPGIEDLRPVAGGGDFLSILREKEIERAPAGQQRVLDIFAFGGKAPWEGLISYMANHALGNSENDLVVETESSISRYLAKREQIQCDHMSYFSGSEQIWYAEVIKYLREKLGFDHAAIERCKKELPLPLDEDTGETLGGVVV